MATTPDILYLYDDALLETIHRGYPRLCVLFCKVRSLSLEIVDGAAPPQPGPLVKAELVQTRSCLVPCAPLLVWISAELQLALHSLYPPPLLSAGMIGVPPCRTYLNLFCGISLGYCRVNLMYCVVLGEEVLTVWLT